MSSPESEVEYWNDPSVAADLQAGSTGVSGFARLVEAQLAPGSRILELGCGTGDDAAFFAEQGHSVIAVDVSQPLVELAQQRFADVPNLQIRRGDVARPLSVGAESNDVVFSRLSMHYFDDETTLRIFSEVFWVLASSGRFFFLCKSTDDPLYGRGVGIGPDMFELAGHIRHFFSVEYTYELMEETGFVDIELTSGTDKFYGEPSAYILCSGTKP